MDIILIIIMSLLLAAFLFFKLGDIFSPWTITTVIWLAIEVMFLFQGDLLDPLGNQFHSCLALWLPIFCASALVTYYVLPRGHTGQTLSDIPDINQALFIVAVWRYPKISKWVLLCIVLANIMCAIAIMEKGSIFFMLLVTVFILYEKRKIPLSRIVIAGVLIVFLFYGINLLRSVDTEAATENNTFMDFFLMYVTIASSNLSPAIRTEQEATMSPSDTIPTSLVPPPISTTMLPTGESTGRPAPIAAAIGSSISSTYLPPA